MLVYRVETRFCSQDPIDRFHKTPASPYGHTGHPSFDSVIWLQENGVNFGRFTHHVDSNFFSSYDIPHPYEDMTLRESFLKFYGANNWHDLGDNILTPFQFGFESVNAVKRWFKVDERIDLLDFGFYVAVFEIDPSHVCLGRTQLCFIRQHAEQVDALYFDEI